GKEYIAEVLNFHFKGACLRLIGVPEAELKLIKGGSYKLDFYLGQSCLQADVLYRVSWSDDHDGSVFGVEFQNKMAGNFERAERFVINPNVPIQVSAKDPLDPHRTLFFQTMDVSETGMLLRTSLSNKHLLPGMKLIATQVMIPTQKSVELDFGIENTRSGAEGNYFLLGVTVRSHRTDYIRAVRDYLSVAVPNIQEVDQYFQKMSTSQFKGKKIKGAVNYRVIATEEDYEKVLKLRFSGYGKHDKVKTGTTWQQQGEGLKNEGLIVGGFLGSQLVSAMELRFGGGSIPLRVEGMLTPDELSGLDLKRVVELNKLVVHPSAQGTDLVLGIMQKAHTIVLNRGQLDVLGVATDRLKSLYEGIGAVSLNKRFPHPFIDNEYLNLMLVKRETYHDGMRFNPHAWSLVYKTVHEHFTAMGLASERSFGIKDRAVAFITRLSIRARKFNSSARGRTDTVSTSRMQVSRDHSKGAFIDPKWTRQEIVAPVMLPYLREASEMVGENSVLEILDRIGVPERYFLKQNNWLSISFHDAFLDEFSKLGDSIELSRRAGIRSMKRDMLGINYFVMNYFLTPELAYATFSKIMPKFNRTRTYEVTELGPRRVRLSLGLVSQNFLPARKESCVNWLASFEAYIQLMTGRPGRVKKTGCCYDGATACTYEVAWDRSRIKIAQLLPLLLACAVGYLGFGLNSTPAITALSIAVGGLGFVSVLLLASLTKMRLLRRYYDTSYQEFLRFQQEAADKYAELQQAKQHADELYREANLIEQTMRDIQQKDDVGSLLQTALDAACSDFKFDRGFAMIVDDERRFLRTAAVSGINSNADLLWSYSVDVGVSKPNPMLLSSVFNSGAGVVIDDVANHIFQLNEASQALVSHFGSKGFVMAAIPARSGNWGVIIADRKTKDRRLTRRDLVVLERLSQQIGLALDKKGDLERERNLRIQFQRYAPSALLHSSLQLGTQSKIGAQMRKVGVLFLDIRGFTRLSEIMPPTKTVELINGLFSLMDPIVRKFGGLVDKYLGDGALVTWGCLGDSIPNSNDMLECATSILEALREHKASRL
ncbi:MAG: GAF domain-containing protein, partial [Proteobacteria bacterium]|nr:GAF domain-containing protein [Pseudomonadota bacterium]